MSDAKRGEVSRDLRTLFNVGTVAGLNDRELLERFTARRCEAAELAFEAILERHGPMVLRVCRQILRDPHNAEDAFQATFMVLARNAGSVRLPEAIGPYLYGVALRVATCARHGGKAEAARAALRGDAAGLVPHGRSGRRRPDRARGIGPSARSVPQRGRPL